MNSRLELDNQLFRVLFDTIPSPIFYKDKKMIYRYCNNAFAKDILGTDKDKIIGKNLHELADFIPKGYADIYNSRDLEIVKANKNYIYEEMVRCYDGVSRLYRFHKAVFSYDGKALGIIGIMYDIDDYRQALRRLNEKNTLLNNITITDFLTGLYNRRYFDEIFEIKLDLIKRNKNKFAFAIIDVDFFKDYNDFFGHDYGDSALQKIADVMKKTMQRKNDFAFRIGGEEFGFLFNANSLEDAHKKMQSFLAQVEELRIESANKTVSEFLTVSAGLGFVEQANIDVVCRDIYHNVDKLLYDSKKSGKNKITARNIKI